MKLLKEINEAADSRGEAQKLTDITRWVKAQIAGTDDDMEEMETLQEIQKILQSNSLDVSKIGDLIHLVKINKDGSDDDMLIWEIADELEKLLK